MFKVSIMGPRGQTVTASTGTLVSDGLKAACLAGKSAIDEAMKAGKKLGDQLSQAGVKFKDAAGNVIKPAISELNALVKAASTYCEGKVEGTANQVKQLVNDAAKYCKDMGIKGKSTFEQVALYLKENGPKMTVTDAPIADGADDMRV